jgi:pimeloyl-ACP methyl ester carboxylesterase
MNPDHNKLGAGPISREIILVHGLWFGSWSMAKLAKRFTQAGYQVRSFDYPSTAQKLDDHARALSEFASGSIPGKNEGHRISFVAHSMGGLVTLRMLDAMKMPMTGRVVLLGTPLSGSEIARRISNIPGGDRLFGQARITLTGGYARIPEGIDTGMIAGTMPLGLGVIAGGNSERGDGTVSSLETDVPGLKDHLELPVTHTGMLYSAEVARQADIFITSGSFEHGSGPGPQTNRKG